MRELLTLNIKPVDVNAFFKIQIERALSKLSTLAREIHFTTNCVKIHLKYALHPWKKYALIEEYSFSHQGLVNEKYDQYYEIVNSPVCILELKLLRSTSQKWFSKITVSKSA